MGTLTTVTTSAPSANLGSNRRAGAVKVKGVGKEALSLDTPARAPLGSIMALPRRGACPGPGGGGGGGREARIVRPILRGVVVEDDEDERTLAVLA